MQKSLYIGFDLLVYHRQSIVRPMYLSFSILQSLPMRHQEFSLAKVKDILLKIHLLKTDFYWLIATNGVDEYVAVSSDGGKEWRLVSLISITSIMFLFVFCRVPKVMDISRPYQIQMFLLRLYQMKVNILFSEQNIISRESPTLPYH